MYLGESMDGMAEDMNKGASMGGPFKPKSQRPVGVTILAVFQILVGLAYLIIGLFAGALAGALIGALGAGILGLLLVPLGIIELIIGLALFTGKNWARILAMIGGVLDLFNIPLGTIFGIVILWYFTRPAIKEFFGK